MLDCLVVGGGQSGLVCGDLLGQAGVRYRVVDSTARAGDIWRARPKNLRLFTSRRFCRLGDLEMPGDPNSFPLGREFADHLEVFAHKKQIAVSYGARVKRLSRHAGGFLAEFEDGTSIRSATVVNATGSNQAPAVPQFAAALDAAVVQLAAQGFREASQFAAGSRVAVVGDGASGRQIAKELADGGHQVFLARGRARKLVPNTLLGLDLFWWLDKTGLLRAHRDSLVARVMRKRDPIPASLFSDARLRDAGVVLKPRAVDAGGQRLLFQGAEAEPVDAVVWCAGYRESVDWIDIPSIRSPDAGSGRAAQASEAGYFLVGRKWLSCRASELILGVERDATAAVQGVRTHLGGRPRQEIGQEEYLNA